MLVVVWDALYQAIPSIQAKEQLAAWTTAVLASPSLTEEGQTERDGILDSWRKLATSGWNSVRGQLVGGSPSGSRDDKWFQPLAVFGSKMKEVLGLGLRE